MCGSAGDKGVGQRPYREPLGEVEHEDPKHQASQKQNRGSWKSSTLWQKCRIERWRL